MRDYDSEHPNPIDNINRVARWYAEQKEATENAAAKPAPQSPVERAGPSRPVDPRFFMVMPKFTPRVRAPEPRKPAFSEAVKDFLDTYSAAIQDYIGELRANAAIVLSSAPVYSKELADRANELALDVQDLAEGLSSGKLDEFLSMHSDWGLNKMLKEASDSSQGQGKFYSLNPDRLKMLKAAAEEVATWHQRFARQRRIGF